MMGSGYFLSLRPFYELEEDGRDQNSEKLSYYEMKSYFNFYPFLR